jgi:hypothetical protein
MKKETREFLKFHMLLGVRAAPRLFIAPYVGAFRGVMAEKEWIDAQMAAFDARQLKAQETSVADAGYPHSHA